MVLSLLTLVDKLCEIFFLFWSSSGISTRNYKFCILNFETFLRTFKIFPEKGNTIFIIFLVGIVPAMISGYFISYLLAFMMYRNTRRKLARYLIAPESDTEATFFQISSIREMRACTLHLFWDIIKNHTNDTETAVERMGQVFLTSLGGAEAETVKHISDQCYLT